MDETKLIIHLHSLGITGYDAETRLREQWNIEVELSDLYNILCLITPGDSDDSIHRLVEALEGLSREFYTGGKVVSTRSGFRKFPCWLSLPGMPSMEKPSRSPFPNPPAASSQSLS